METIYDIFKEYDTNVVCVSDFDLIYRGARIDYVVLNDDNSVSLWAGNPDPGVDKWAEELVMSKNDMKTYLELIIDEF